MAWLGPLGDTITRDELASMHRVPRVASVPLWENRFDDTGDWADYGGNCTIAADHASGIVDRNFPLRRAIKFTAAGGATNDFRARFTLAAPLDLRHSHLYGKFYVHPGTSGGNDDYAHIDSIMVAAHDGAAMTDYRNIYLWKKLASALYSHPGMNEVSLCFDDFLNDANSPDLSSIDYILLQHNLVDSTNRTSEVTWLDLRFETKPTKGVVVWTFDNIYAGSHGGWTKSQKDACDYLLANGMKANLFFTHLSVGGAGRLTQAELDTLHGQGHLMCNYPYGLSKYWRTTEPNMSLAEKQYCLAEQADWMATKGYHKGKRIFSTPGGNWNTEDDEEILGKFADCCGVMDGPAGLRQVQGFSNMQRLCRSSADYNANFVAEPLAYAISGGGLLNNFHHLDGATDTTTKAQFEAEADAVKTQIDAGTMECLTINELLDRYML